jgi:hypothetical protein
VSEKGRELAHSSYISCISKLSSNTAHEGLDYLAKWASKVVPYQREGTDLPDRFS